MVADIGTYAYFLRLSIHFSHEAMHTIGQFDIERSCGECTRRSEQTGACPDGIEQQIERVRERFCAEAMAATQPERKGFMTRHGFIPMRKRRQDALCGQGE